ncbi:Transport system permease protein [sediment metagenome]|uniref:Transport system permease protein n=1 Tax=sediment metagenome TaxID=749907 RepID=D9PFT8_9ZZZZ
MIKLEKHSSVSLYFILMGALLILTLVSLCSGPAGVSLTDGIRDLAAGKPSAASTVISQIRIPRILLALMVGASLGMAGAAMQGFLRNPLAEPGVLGVSGGAALGAVLAFYSGWYARWAMALPLAGMIGAFLSAAFILALAGLTASVHTLILAGLAINTMTFALTSLVLNLLSLNNPYASLEIMFWSMGSLADRNMSHVLLALPWIIAGWILLLSSRRGLDALSLGEDAAATLGIPVWRMRLCVILGTACSVGASVALCGNIGFVGLMIPHFLRPFVRHEPGRLLGTSALGGAIFLLLADLIVRLVPQLADLKVGVVTALAGAPFFLYLLFRMRRGLS